MTLKWPKTLKNVGMDDIKVSYLNRKKYDEIAGDGVGLVDFVVNEIYICTDYTTDRAIEKYGPRTPEEIMVTLIHELIHVVADNNSSGNLNEEAAVDMVAREITKMLVACGIKFPPNPEVKK